ncbi:DJ-1/PfpI family protein [Streptomyces roseoverticillatus]|uniref:DJ-1/PfpI family protein n=1 Tax=Streptomyces roseoverticillatus TaxID=66429 RepID=UPI001F3DD8CB|nr:DJ-1/PfpI family protein [Streptomyces roseoverticillatus]MCF3102842.1 DJ-1/PfpI family protein [Streptomyces roseoverticillatus]
MRTSTGPSRRGVLGTAVAGALGVAAAGAPAHAAAAGDDVPRAGERVVAILLYDGFTALDAIGPYEVLCRVPGVRVVTVGVRQAGPVRTDTGELGIVAERTLAEVPAAHVLLVPGGGPRGQSAAGADPAVQRWIRRIDRGSVWTTSVCTGSLILGAAGLLRGVPATTHWAARPLLEETGAVWTRQRFVEHGKIITAAGVSAGIDMGLHLASRLAGDDVARAMQLGVEYDPAPPFDSGSVEKADEHTKQLALKLLNDASL